MMSPSMEAHMTGLTAGPDFSAGPTLVWQQVWQQHIRKRAYERGVLIQKLSGHEVYRTNALILLIKIMLCSKLHHQKVLG